MIICNSFFFLFFSFFTSLIFFDHFVVVTVGFGLMQSINYTWPMLVLSSHTDVLFQTVYYGSGSACNFFF